LRSGFWPRFDQSQVGLFLMRNLKPDQKPGFEWARWSNGIWTSQLGSNFHLNNHNERLLLLLLLVLFFVSCMVVFFSFYSTCFIFSHRSVSFSVV